MLDYLVPLVAYLCGSISSAVIVSALMGLPDPRAQGSHNPGATNVLRLGGRTGAALTLAGDVGKGALPVWLAVQLEVAEVSLACSGLCAFLGHLYPVFFGFRGGKGVATAFGALLVASPAAAGILALAWLATAAAFRYSSVSSLSAAALAPPTIFWSAKSLPLTVMGTLIAVGLFWRHRGNLRRLLDGSETRIGERGGDA